jgi:hypothetical protein
VHLLHILVSQVLVLQEVATPYRGYNMWQTSHYVRPNVITTQGQALVDWLWRDVADCDGHAEEAGEARGGGDLVGRRHADQAPLRSPHTMSALLEISPWIASPSVVASRPTRM